MGWHGEDMGSLMLKKLLWLAWKRLEKMQSSQLGGFVGVQTGDDGIFDQNGVWAWQEMDRFNVYGGSSILRVF